MCVCAYAKWVRVPMPNVCVCVPMPNGRTVCPPRYVCAYVCVLVFAWVVHVNVCVPMYVFLYLHGLYMDTCVCVCSDLGVVCQGSSRRAVS